MSKKFYAPARYRMALPGNVNEVDGGLIFPAGVSADSLIRRDLEKKHPHLYYRLLDPQLYLSSLQAVNCRKVCATLSSYPWFNSLATAPYESAKQTQAERRKELSADIHTRWSGQVPVHEASIRATIASCVDFQGNIGCEAIILPSPLTVDQNSNYSIETGWIDKGIEYCQKTRVSAPCYPTIAISDNALRALNPYENDLLTVIVDQLTSRSVSGVYIVIEQSNEAGYHCAHSNTIGALLRLCYELRRGGIENIALGPMGFGGILALHAGATKWSSGWYRTERRVKLLDFDDSRGLSYPTFCSYPAATDISLDTDMDRLVEAGYLPKIADETYASESLMHALADGNKSSSVTEWAYRPSNISAAREHFLRIATRETRRIGAMSSSQALSEGLNWVINAENSATAMYRHGPFNNRTELNHQAAWSSAYKRFLASI